MKAEGPEAEEDEEEDSSCLSSLLRLREGKNLDEALGTAPEAAVGGGCGSGLVGPVAAAGGDDGGRGEGGSGCAAGDSADVITNCFCFLSGISGNRLMLTLDLRVEVVSASLRAAGLDGWRFRRAGGAGGGAAPGRAVGAGGGERLAGGWRENCACEGSGAAVAPGGVTGARTWTWGRRGV